MAGTTKIFTPLSPRFQNYVQLFDFFLACRYYQKVSTGNGVDMTRQRTLKQRLYPLITACAAFVMFSLPLGALVQGDNPLDFTLVDMAGNKVRLGDLAEGKPLLLYFWAIWCKPCRLVQPRVATLAKEYQGRLTVLGINVGGVDSLKSIKEYGQRYKIPYPLLMDADNLSVKAYSVSAIPTVILLNETGKVLFRDNEAPPDLEKLLPG
jgi:thiol-disulfide isomerase/thioredoxin